MKSRRAKRLRSDQSTFKREFESGKELERRFPSEFKTIRKLVEDGRKVAARKGALIGDLVALNVASEKFVAVIGAAVRILCDRLQNKKHGASTKDAFAAFHGSIQSLDDARTAFANLDSGAVAWLELVISMFVPVAAKENGALNWKELRASHVLEELESLRDKLELWSRVLKFVTGEELHLTGKHAVGRRGRPSNPYIVPTLALIELWRQLTGIKASSPKNSPCVKYTKFIQADQISTEFVRVCLTMIDPNLPVGKSARTAVTAIKRAREVEERLQAIIRSQIDQQKSVTANDAVVAEMFGDPANRARVRAYMSER